jgi:hypothetical protein
MFRPTWLRLRRPHTIRRPSPRASRFVRLQLEELEERTLLSPIVLRVNSLADAGTGTGTTGDLRYCINKANQNNNSSKTTPDQIIIPSGLSGTITLKQGELLITDPNLVINGPNGPGASTIAVSGNNASRIFSIASGTSVDIHDLTIEKGKAPTQGGGILDQGGSAALTNVVVQSNSVQAASATGPGSPGLNAQGGGIYVSGGTLSFKNSTIKLNFVAGGRGGNGVQGTTKSPNGGDGGTGGSSQGGGIYSINSNLLIDNSFFLENNAGDTPFPSSIAGGVGGPGGDADPRVSGANGGRGGMGGKTQGGGLCAFTSSIAITNTFFSVNESGGLGGLGGRGGVGGLIGKGGVGGAGADNEGGAVYCNSCTVTIANSSLKENFDTGGIGGQANSRGTNGATGGTGGAGGTGQGGGFQHP